MSRTATAYSTSDASSPTLREEPSLFYDPTFDTAPESDGDFGAPGASSRLSIASILEALRAPGGADRLAALDALAEIVGTAYGEDGADLGAEMRARGGVALLASLLADELAEVQQAALLVLGNLVSDSVDSASAETKRVLLQCGAAKALLSSVYASDPYVLMLACGCLQVRTGWHCHSPPSVPSPPLPAPPLPPPAPPAEPLL